MDTLTLLGARANLLRCKLAAATLTKEALTGGAVRKFIQSGARRGVSDDRMSQLLSRTGRWMAGKDFVPNPGSNAGQVFGGAIGRAAGNPEELQALEKLTKEMGQGLLAARGWKPSAMGPSYSPTGPTAKMRGVFGMPKLPPIMGREGWHGMGHPSAGPTTARASRAGPVGSSPPPPPPPGEPPIGSADNPFEASFNSAGGPVERRGAYKRMGQQNPVGEQGPFAMGAPGPDTDLELRNIYRRMGQRNPIGEQGPFAMGQSHHGMTSQTDLDPFSRLLPWLLTGAGAAAGSHYGATENAPPPHPAASALHNNYLGPAGFGPSPPPSASYYTGAR